MLLYFSCGHRPQLIIGSIQLQEIFSWPKGSVRYILLAHRPQLIIGSLQLQDIFSHLQAVDHPGCCVCVKTYANAIDKSKFLSDFEYALLTHCNALCVFASCDRRMRPTHASVASDSRMSMGSLNQVGDRPQKTTPMFIDTN